MVVLCALQIKMRQQDEKILSTAKVCVTLLQYLLEGYCWAVEQLVTIDESASSVQMNNEGERLVGASEKLYICRGASIVPRSNQFLRHEHESSVAWSLFASDDRLKDCFSFGCLFDDQTFYLFAKTGEVFEVHEFGWNDKTKVCFSWKYDCVGTFPASTVQFECKRAISSPSLIIFAWPLNLEMIALCNQRQEKASTLLSWLHTNDDARVVKPF